MLIESSNFTLYVDMLTKTAYHPTITGRHRAAATNALCSLLGLAKNAESACRLDRDRWFQIFSIFLDRSSGSKSKPIRQLLTSLVAVLSTYAEAEKQDVMANAVVTMLQMLSAQSDHVKVKSALQVLSHFLSKQVIDLGMLLLHLRTLQPMQSARDRDDLLSDNELLQWLLRTLMDWIRYPDTAPAASQTVCVVVKATVSRPVQNFPADDLSLPSIWTTPLIASLQEYPEALAGFKYHLLPALFALDGATYVSFIKKLGLYNVLQDFSLREELGESPEMLKINLLFTSLEIGKEAGMVLATCTCSYY